MVGLGPRLREQDQRFDLPSTIGVGGRSNWSPITEVGGDGTISILLNTFHLSGFSRDAGAGLELVD